jgi:thioredoxin 1
MPICDNVTEGFWLVGYDSGKTKRRVRKMSVINLNRNNFSEVVAKSDKPVLIDFWAPWCSPCRMQSPVIEELAGEVKGSAVIAKLNVDENPELASHFSVMSIPTIISFKDGKIVGRKTGFTPKGELLGLLGQVKA